MKCTVKEKKGCYDGATAVPLLVLLLFVGCALLIGLVFLRWPAQAFLGLVGVPLVVAFIGWLLITFTEMVGTLLRIVVCVALFAWRLGSALLCPFTDGAKTANR